VPEPTPSPVYLPAPGEVPHETAPADRPASPAEGGQ
jgi:hypothetical protein